MTVQVVDFVAIDPYKRIRLDEGQAKIEVAD